MTGAELRAARQALGLTLTQLAQVAGYHWCYLGWLERSSRALHPRAADILRRALETAQHGASHEP